MTREELIKAIYDNEEKWSCPEYSCNKPEEEENTGACCWKCAEKQLAEYERQIREEVIDELLHKMGKLSNYARPVGWTKKLEIIPMSTVRDIAEEMKGE